MLVFLVLAASCVNLGEITVSNPDFSKIADGTYRGESKVGPVRVTLDVSVRNGAIASMQIIKHRNGRGKKAEAIVPRMVEAQSLDVDVVSGATASSKAFMLAAENALSGK